MRRKSGNGYLLTGILKCGYCGWSMVGSGNGDKTLYRCDWRHRAGHAVCPQPAIVAYTLHDQVCDWIAKEVVTYERLVALREQFNAELANEHQPLRDQLAERRTQFDRVAKQIGNLLGAIERGGWNQEVQDRLDERKREKLQLETDIQGIEFKLKLGQIRVSDDVLHYMADHLQEALAARHPDYARRLIQMVVPKAELFKEKLRLYYSPEILMETLTLSGSQGKSVIWTVPPWEFESQSWP